jgi:hypothetical protein
MEAACSAIYVQHNLTKIDRIWWTNITTFSGYSRIISYWNTKLNHQWVLKLASCGNIGKSGKKEKLMIYVQNLSTIINYHIYKFIVENNGL